MDFCIDVTYPRFYSRHDNTLFIHGRYRNITTVPSYFLRKGNFLFILSIFRRRNIAGYLFTGTQSQIYLLFAYLRRSGIDFFLPSLIGLGLCADTVRRTADFLLSVHILVGSDFVLVYFIFLQLLIRPLFPNTCLRTGNCM